MTEQDILLLRKWVHDLNNRVGAIMASAELLQMEQLSPKALDRSKLIESKALELRDIIRKISEHYSQ